jgi:uncharacterized protein YggU (UPF0235/DUF167 family)
VAGTYGDALKIRIAAPAVDGKANDALLKFIAVLLGVPPAAVVLANGITDAAKYSRSAMQPKT